MFQRLEREHGITHYLAHNMTVTPRNLDQVAGVIRDCRDMGFRMFSFQPAAFIGNESRWKDDYRAFSTDRVWEEIERGAGARLHYRALQIGDERCNRTAYGAYAATATCRCSTRTTPPTARWLQDFLAAFGGMDFDGAAAAASPRGWRAASPATRARCRGSPAGRGASRRAAGGVRARGGATAPRALTYVMHAFMDARDVRPAWEAPAPRRAAPTTRASARPRSACRRAPTRWPTRRTARSCPACAQHAVLDPAENLRLRELLPLRAARRTAG